MIAGPADILARGGGEGGTGLEYLYLASRSLTTQAANNNTETTNASSACARNHDPDSAGSDADETADSEGLNDAMLQLFVSDTEGSDFEGFEEDDDY